MATSNPKKLLITGPESSGKSTLVAELASQLKCNYVPEYARVYLRILGTEYREEDLDIILQGQLRTEKNASNTSTEFLVCDTGPLVVYIWSLEVYGRTSDLITKSLSHLKSYHKIFLCHPDIPWEPDDLRENPQDRDRLFIRYKETLQNMSIPFTEIKGNHKFQQAIKELRKSETN